MKNHKFKISLLKIRYFTANLNAILLLVGYALFTSLVFGVGGESDISVTRGFSIYYRAFAIIIALLTIMLNINKPLLSNKNILLYFLLWALFSCRIIYDLFFRISELTPDDKSFFFQFIFGAVLIPTIAIYLSHRNLNLKLIYYSVFFVLIIVVTKGIILNLVFITILGQGRTQMNIAQSTLTFGSFGGILSLLSFSMVTSKVKNYKLKLFFFFTLIWGLFAVALAGSRGPFFGVVITIFISFYLKNAVASIKTSFLIIIIVIIFGTQIVELVKTIAPALYERTYSTVVDSSLGGRESVFDQAVNQIVKHPIFGDWFLLDRADLTSYAHNAFLGAVMSIGILGGILVIYLYFILFKYSLKVIRTQGIYSFWGYSTLFYIVYSMTTGGDIYIKTDFNFSFLILLLIFSKSTNLYSQVFTNIESA